MKIIKATDGGGWQLIADDGNVIGVFPTNPGAWCGKAYLELVADNAALKKRIEVLKRKPAPAPRPERAAPVPAPQPEPVPSWPPEIEGQQITELRKKLSRRSVFPDVDGHSAKMKAS